MRLTVVLVFIFSLYFGHAMYTDSSGMSMSAAERERGVGGLRKLPAQFDSMDQC